jgi:hypothetical protein
MRRVNARSSNSCLWILLLHLPPSSALRIFLDALIKRLRRMEVDMHANLTFATSRFLHQTRLVFVNDRIPRTDRNCALCGEIVEKGYVRDLQTRLIYCDAQCFPGEPDMAMAIIENRARKVS